MLFMSQKNYIKWIITALKCETDLAPRCKISVLSENEISTDTEDSVLPEELLTVSPPENNGDADEIYEALSKRFNFKYPHSASAKIPSKLSVSRLYPEVLDSLSIAENIFSDNEISRVYDLSEFMPTESTLESSSEFPEFDNFTSQKMPSENTPPVDNSKNMKIPSFLLDEPTVTGAEKGTATHIFMQFCDFDYIEKNGIEAEIKRLAEKRFILPAHADLIDISAIRKFLKSEIYKEMRSATSTEREYRFNIKLPASDFTSNEELKRELENEFVFVQGVIDCYFRDENGNIILLDYKTDRVPMDVFGDFQKENRFFTERYSLQLKYYQSALEKLTGKRVYKTLIYSFALGRCIELT
jgi:ATP-dependent helicase/nuclease subunit A